MQARTRRATFAVLRAGRTQTEIRSWFRIRELSFNKVREIQQMSSGADFAAAIITAGVVEPNLRDERLQQAGGAVTPYEVVRKMLRAGEIEDLQAAIEKLSGYRASTLELLADIEKN